MHYILYLYKLRKQVVRNCHWDNYMYHYQYLIVNVIVLVSGSTLENSVIFPLCGVTFLLLDKKDVVSQSSSAAAQRETDALAVDIIIARLVHQ